MASAQYAFRAQKVTGIADSPSWAVTGRVPADAAATRAFAYSPDGQWFAYASAETVELLSAADEPTSAPRTIAQANVVAVSFSPKSSWLFTYERPVKSDTDVHKNVKAWDIATGENVGGWYWKTGDDWVPTITADEAHLLRPTASDLLVFTPPLAPRPVTRLKGDGQIKNVFLSAPTSLPEGATSSKPIRPYQEPAVAVWVGEKKGAPASVALYPLSSLLGKAQAANGEVEQTENRDFPMTLSRKAFYKADKLNVKWNNAGTMALFLTHTDVDNTGKSYYGETNLYLVGLDGKFDGLVDLDKEGPIYDFNWNPNSREFTVCYGYMPARTQTYDLKAKPTHLWGNNPRNFVLYQPQGRLLLSAGFGNLAGGIDIWEVSTRKKIAEFTASNSSHCEWSPCGRYILTATLSPRLRVDNGVKIWWAGGQLLHIHPQDDLYQASFRPGKVEDTPTFPAVVPKAPEANPSVAQFKSDKEENGVAAKPMGAYRPPGARGNAASDAYLRRDDDSAPSSGASTPMFKGGKPAQRYIPGGGVPGAPPGAAADKGEKKKRTRSKNKKGQDAAAEDVPAAAIAKLEVTAEAAAGDDDANTKKIRNLTKKLKAIDDLKARVAKGEVLEKTQLQKIETEASVRSEIQSLGGDA
ncbi:Eukaryotic translation initiation factor 2A [Vanrija pseudolonga]|uniref:Eukaryotic translation initiation factor 2A n=1 Tax=Vanrija pseudolonga TaxID=143232 RepID=A0AAF0Y9W2_9TREE|nr:Eukaryotic translation initiation factor 2A [Vanrija pseudolonga]